MLLCWLKHTRFSPPRWGYSAPTPQPSYNSMHYCLHPYHYQDETDDWAPLLCQGSGTQLHQAIKQPQHQHGRNQNWAILTPQAKQSRDGGWERMRKAGWERQRGRRHTLAVGGIEEVQRFNASFLSQDIPLHRCEFCLLQPLRVQNLEGGFFFCIKHPTHQPKVFLLAVSKHRGGTGQLLTGQPVGLALVRQKPHDSCPASPSELLRM